MWAVCAEWNSYAAADKSAIQLPKRVTNASTHQLANESSEQVSFGCAD